jgi:hypothetical protein
MYSTINKLRKHYGNLSALERFQAMLAAHARGDAEEARALVQACPKKNYTMHAWPFAGMHNALITVVLLAYLELMTAGTMLAATQARINDYPEFWDIAKDKAREVLAIRDAIRLFFEEVLGAGDAVIRDYMPAEDAVVELTIDMAERLLAIDAGIIQHAIEATPEAEREAEREAQARKALAGLRKVWERALE